MEPVNHRRTHSDSAALRRASSPRAQLSPYSSPVLTPRTESDVQSLTPYSANAAKPVIMTAEVAALPQSQDLPASTPSSPTLDCAICQMPMEDPAVGGGCAHHFCLPCYEEWCQRKASCPTCRAPVWKIVVDTEFAAQSGIDLSSAHKANVLAAGKKPAGDNPEDVIRTNSKERTVDLAGPAGITLANRSSGDGCYVVRVIKYNGAYRAGIRAGDVILQVNGAEVHDHNMAVAFIEARCRVGDCEVTFRSQPDVRQLVTQTLLRRVRPRATVSPSAGARSRTSRSSPLAPPRYGGDSSSEDLSTSPEDTSREHPHHGQENVRVTSPLLRAVPNSSFMLASPIA